MSRFTDIQTALADALRAHPEFPAKLTILARREKEVASDVEAALGKQGICLYVMPPMPKGAVRTDCAIVFFDSCELRLRVIEQPQLNLTELDAWDILEAIILALQGTNPGGIFAAPLNLMPRPIESVEDKTTRVFDVLFDGAFQLNG